MIYIAGDHNTIELIQKIEQYLDKKDFAYKNFGAKLQNQKTKLQDIIPAVVEPVRKDEESVGILVCGTGAGVEIGANRFKGIRATLCTTSKQAEYARVYDNANILCLSSWITEDPDEVLTAWLENEFDGDANRAQMITDFDRWS